MILNFVPVGRSQSHSYFFINNFFFFSDFSHPPLLAQQKEHLLHRNYTPCIGWNIFRRAIHYSTNLHKRNHHIEGILSTSFAGDDHSWLHYKNDSYGGATIFDVGIGDVPVSLNLGDG